MSDEIIRSIVTIAVAIVGVATLSVIVSRNAQTPQVIQAAGNSFAGALAAAVSPVTGGGGVSLGMNPYNTL
jgi:hypothetical protein